MTILRLTLLTLFIATIGVVSTFAQATRPAAPAAPAADAPIPAAKVALINSNAFYDDKAGIVRLYKALDAVDREFEPRSKELETLNADITKRTNELASLQAQLNNPGTPVKAADVQTKAFELDQLKRDLQRKVQDAQDGYKRRMAEVQAPIIDDIVKALNTYAAQHGITLTLDAAKMPDAIMTVVPSIDITDAFIKDYNSHNPATTAAARP